VVGTQIQVKIVKNKHAPPFKTESHPDRNKENANPDASITVEFVSATDEEVPEEVGLKQ
ncbi:hypothetical protein E2562_018041, partial [Oryza meyeriana var. granulata]